MRRIYESEAVDRNDTDPFRPNERDAREKPQAARSLPQQTLAKWVVPQRLHRRAITVTIKTPNSVYSPDDRIPISVGMHNRMPFPVSVKTVSPVRWTWSVDGRRQTPTAPTDMEAAHFQFDRGERKRFGRHWTQTFRVSNSEWETVRPGEYTISAALNVDDPKESGLHAETTITIE